jgi:uncharacterized OB-fold protein
MEENKLCQCKYHTCENCGRKEVKPLEECPRCKSKAFHLKIE